MSSTSSCTLPLVIIRNSCLNKPIPISQVIVHNTELLKDNLFFKENVLAHCKLPDVPFQFFGRQRIIDWINDYLTGEYRSGLNSYRDIWSYCNEYELQRCADYLENM